MPRMLRQGGSTQSLGGVARGQCRWVTFPLEPPSEGVHPVLYRSRSQMDATTAAGLIGAGGAVLGALAAGGAAVAVEGRRSRAGRLEAHRHEIRSVCSKFTSAIA